ncbi:MAG TPA: ATP-binding protein [Patescibacteria group bacterium]|nr:ATP-binding protein [Patescibacteria group bacterium]
MPIITIIHIIAIAINIILAIVVIRNRHNPANIIFAFLNFSIAFWTMANIETSLVESASMQLFWVRMVMFSAVVLSSLFYLFIKTFPERKFKLNNSEKIFFYLVVPLVALFTQTSYVFSGVTKAPGQLIPTPIVEPGISIFGITVLICIGLGIILLARRYRFSTGELKAQMKLLLIGVGLMFALILSFDFFAVVVFHVTFFISLSPIYTMVFLLLATYAIVKYHLFNLKVIGTEALIVGISIALFSQLFTEDNPSQRWVEGFILVSTILLGYLLIRSVKKEVEQREQLEILDKELEAANEKLKVLDKARAEFISIASHQLRTPPATIKWYLAAVTAGDFGPVPEKVQKAVSTAEMTNNSQISLIDDLLNASRIERGKMEFVFEPTDILKITQITVDQLTPQALQRKQKLLYTPPKGEFPQVNADREKLRQVINNLVDNSIKYTPTGGWIKVELAKTAKDVQIRVSDNGRGIKPGEEKNIFTKYDRGGKKMDSQGLGLGLYVAKVIIEQHKGKIWATSDGENKGATFTISLPLKTDLKNSTFDLAKPAK